MNPYKHLCDRYWYFRFNNWGYRGWMTSSSNSAKKWRSQNFNPGSTQEGYKTGNQEISNSINLSESHFFSLTKRANNAYLTVMCELTGDITFERLYQLWRHYFPWCLAHSMLNEYLLLHWFLSLLIRVAVSASLACHVSLHLARYNNTHVFHFGKEIMPRSAENHFLV